MTGVMYIYTDIIYTALIQSNRTLGDVKRLGEGCFSRVSDVCLLSPHEMTKMKPTMTSPLTF